MCKCIQEANKALAAQHMAITTAMMITGFGKKGANMRKVITLPVHSTKKGVKAKVVPINFCPLCGERQS